jgi:2-(1,2-epoxy-1,2-dihydrophenyl)acetyl-CoA isomerase
MTYEALTFEVADGVATITINRPEAANSLNLTLAEELLKVATKCDADPAIRAVLLTGSGKMFCAGGDVPTFAKIGDGIGEYMRHVTTGLHGAVARFARMDAPLIIAVNGVAAGAGMSIALTGDIIFAAASAKFTMAYTAIGMVPDGSSSFFLPRLVGPLKAKELILTNPRLSADEALALGIVTEVVADDELMERARACAAQLAAGPTKSYGAAKRLLADTFSNSLETQMELETRAISDLAQNTHDGREGIMAFAEKRKPDFRGN